MSEAHSQLESGLADRYRIDRELGRGGMATVYLAEDLKHQRSVAVKVILPELVSAVGSGRFLREIEVAAKLRHPNILPLLDSGSVDGLLYYVMPHVEGETLRDKLAREKQLPIHEALRLAGEVLDALSYSHAQGVIHRDIKPSNIMLDSGHAVVADFGIALVARDVPSERLTVTGGSPGSPAYMSPEQASGEQDLDARTDIYSLGCVLYEMLAGEPPYTGSNPQAILAKKLMGSLPRLRVVRDSVPEFVERAVTVALAKSPADRFRSADGMGQALKGDARGGATFGASWPLSAEGEPGAPTSRWALAAIVAGAPALLTTIGVLTTRVYDLRLGIPVEHVPSRTDFTLIGAHALVPAVLYCFAGAVAYVVLRMVLRAAALGLNRVPNVEQTVRSIQHRSTRAWQKLWRPMETSTVADTYFIGGIVVALAVLAFFRPLLEGTIWSSDTEVLSCSSRPLHRAYQIVTPLLTAGLALAWFKFLRYLRTRGARGGRVALAKWGGLAWVFIIAIVMTMPWLLLYDNVRPRALLDGEPAYVLVETETGMVIYSPQTNTTTRIGRSEAHRIDRLGTEGYVFEDPGSFLGPDPGC